MTFVKTDILNPYNREILSTDSYPSVIDFLIASFPSGFEKPTDISVNGHKIEVDDYDTELKDGDVIVLLDRSALPVGLIGGWFVTALANLAISVTLSYVANRLFAPDAPGEQPQPSAVYNLNSAQNTARFGSPIPVVYGKVRMYPSMIVQPYYKFEDNVEYLYHVLCVGQGTLTTDKVYIGTDDVDSNTDLLWKLLYKDSFYDIPYYGYGVHITNTLSSPSTMEIKDGSAESEKYTIRKEAQYVEFDYMLPNGLFYVKGDGDYSPTSRSFIFRVYTVSGGTYTEVYSKTILHNTMTVDAIQSTFRYDISAYNEPVYITFESDYYYGHPRDTHDLYIKRVKEIFPNEDFTGRYGDITLLVCKIKATNAVSSAGQVKINGYFERTDVGNTMHEVLTDIYTNTNYGGALSAGDLSFPVTTETVDCAYEENMTIFDAMRKPAIAQGYSLFLAGMDVILKKDAPNTVTTAMYNEMNILRNSFKAQYLFKEEYPTYDGFECKYIDADGWIVKSEKYPDTSTRPQVVDLFGVVDWSTYSPIDPLTEGLIHYYPLDTDSIDVIGGANGVDTNITYSGSSAIFDRTGNIEAVNYYSNTMSVSIWINYTDTSTSRAVIVRELLTTPDTGISVWVAIDGTLELRLDSGSTAEVLPMTSTYIAGVWHNIILTIDEPNNQIKAYLDGVLCANTTYKNCDSNTNWFFGYNELPASGSGPYFGYQSEARFYDRVISAETIAAIQAKGH